MTRRNFFAAFLVCVLLLAGGLHLTARSIRELRGEKAGPTGVIPPRVGGLMAKAGRTAGDFLGQLSALLREGRAASLCREALGAVKNAGLPEVADRIRTRFGPVLRNLETFLRPKTDEHPAGQPLDSRIPGPDRTTACFGTAPGSGEI